MLTYHPQKGHGYGDMTVLKFCRLPRCSASRGCVSNSWVSYWDMQAEIQTDKQKGKNGNVSSFEVAYKGMYW